MTKRRLSAEELSKAIDRAIRAGRSLAIPSRLSVCGQMFDIRDLEQMLYHARGEHEPTGTGATARTGR
jgi:hypothetical protein